MKQPLIIPILLGFFAIILPANAQPAFPHGFFGGISVNTSTGIGSADTLAAGIVSLKENGVQALRVELQGPQAIARLDTLLCVTDTHGMPVFVAVPDTLLMEAGAAAIPSFVTSRQHRVAAYTIVWTNHVRLDTLLKSVADFCGAAPATLHGVSLPNAADEAFRQLSRLPAIDFVGLNLGYRQQRWASLDRVQEAMGHVFTRLPFIVRGAVEALELLEKPLIIDYIDYPRDRAYHHPGSAVRIRNNVLNAALRQQADYPESLRGLFLGSWMPDPDVVSRPPTESVFTSDTSTITILTAKRGSLLQ